MYHVYRRYQSSRTNPVTELEDHSNQDNRCFNVNLDTTRITGVRTEYKKAHFGGTRIFTTY